jgi:hypothetical protein
MTAVIPISSWCAVADILAFTVPIEGGYASVNNIGANMHRAGKKSPEYVRLYRAVYDAAKAEMARIGWETASCECFATVVRYMDSNRSADASNNSKCEFDAMEEAGVWANDCLANPPLLWIRRDFQGPHRVAIAVVKLYEPGNARTEIGRRKDIPDSAKQHLGTVLPAENRAADRRANVDPIIAAWNSTDKIPNGYVSINGKLKKMTVSEALAMGEKRK